MIASTLLTSCGAPDRDLADKYEMTVSEMRSEKAEKHSELSHETVVTFTTTATLELQSEDGIEKPSALGYFTVVEETGIGDNGTIPQLLSSVFDHGRSQLKIVINKEVPDGQALPTPPKYSLRLAAVELFETCKPAVAGPESTSAANDDTAICELSIEQPKVYETNSSYNSRHSLSVKVHGAMAKQPLLMFCKVTTTSHPEKEKIGEVTYEAALVVNGEGSIDHTEFLSLNYTFDDDLRKQPTEKPVPSQIDVSIVGLLPLTSVGVRQK
jgi:hypothetical protein